MKKIKRPEVDELKKGLRYLLEYNMGNLSTTTIIFALQDLLKEYEEELEQISKAD